MRKISILLFIIISLVLFIPQFYLLGFIRNSYFEDFWKQYLNRIPQIPKLFALTTLPKNSKSFSILKEKLLRISVGVV